MKKTMILFGFFSVILALTGCSNDSSRITFDGRTGKTTVQPLDEYGEPPARYLVDEKGRYIDEKGNLSDHPVENPYYIDYMKKHQPK